MKVLNHFQASRFPYYLLFLPLFFVLHGYVDYYDIVLFDDALLLFVRYSIAALVLLTVFYFLFKSWQKAALFTFILLFFHFFFGSLHDAFKSLLNNSLLTTYTFILPFSMISLGLVFFLLRKVNRDFSRLTTYLTIVLVVLIIIDTALLIPKVGWPYAKSREALPATYVDCKSCNKPDVYFIIADEYAGHEQLKTLLNFDNSHFENNLKVRGFHVVKNSRSNYNSTPFSVASITNMEYLRGIKGEDDLKDDLKICYEKINRNSIAAFFKSSGYQIINYSIFNFADITTNDLIKFFPLKERMISSQTFLSRLERDVFHHIIIRFNLDIIAQKSIFNELNYNRKTLSNLWNEVERPAHQPRFIYCHLLMPHFPYYYDEKGALLSAEELTKRANEPEEEYTNYLQYSNTKFINLFDHILTKSRIPPIIIFMGDHGFRFYTRSIDTKFQFMSINAIYLPQKQYHGFYDGMSNVNQFRVLLNTAFGQKIPLLRDSSVYIR